MIQGTEKALLSALPYIVVGDDGSPHLAGSRCRNCGQVHVGRRSICPRCAGIDSLDAIRLSETGRLYAYTIVSRSFPGVDVPFIAATVDLDGGGTVKGNIVDVLADPAQLAFDMRVRVRFQEAGRPDAAGNRYLAYVFVPDQGSSHD